MVIPGGPEDVEDVYIFPSAGSGSPFCQYLLVPAKSQLFMAKACCSPFTNEELEKEEEKGYDSKGNRVT